MMKIQSAAEGDVTDHWKEYSHEESLAHTVSIIGAYIDYKKIEGPPDLRAYVKRMLRHLENTSKCQQESRLCLIDRDKDRYVRISAPIHHDG